MSERAESFESPEEFSLTQWATIVGVSAYLLVAGLWLVRRGVITPLNPWKLLKARLRAPYAGPVQDMRPEAGFCYLAPLPASLLSDMELVSTLRLYEDGKPLGPAHAPHADIRTNGGGRFSHWGEALYFSTSDNSSPITNGRAYTVQEEPSHE